MPAASVLDGQLVDAVEELAVGAVCGTGAQLYIVLHIYICYITSSHWLHNRMLSANRTMLTYYGTFLVTRSDARSLLLRGGWLMASSSSAHPVRLEGHWRG